MVELASPWWLLSLLFVPLIVFWRPGKIPVTILRALAWILLALALAGPGFLLQAPGGTITYLVDRSRSIRATLEPTDVPRNANVEPRFMFFGDDHSSDIGLSLSAAAAETEEFGGKIVLLSDGQDTGDRVEEALEVLVRRGISVDVLPLAPTYSDVALNVQAPRILGSNERFDLVVEVASLAISQATLTILVDGTPTSRQELRLQDGQNLFQLPLALIQPGIHSIEGSLTAAGDLFLENNTSFAFPTVLAGKGILVVSAQPNGDRFASFLTEQGVPNDLMAPAALPEDAKPLTAYEGIVLVDVDNAELAPAQVNALTLFVRTLGGGLLVIGGGHSYTLGNYFRSPLEEILPVVSQPRLEQDLPEMAVVFVVDNSSSMWQKTGEFEKLDLAQEVAVRASAPLREQDQVGVLAFSDQPNWLLPIGPGRNFSLIKEKILTKGPGGGTNAFLALSEALQQLRQTDAKLKHIIFISDGKSQQGEFPTLIQQARREDVYVTALAVGEDADLPFMEEIATGGEGKFAHVIAPEQIPSVLFPPSQEKPQKAFEEGETYLSLASSRSPLSGFQPLSLQGYLKGQAKEKALIIFQAAKTTEPVLAVWNQGQGRVACWLADFSGVWTQPWASWPEQSTFWLSLLRWTAPVQENLPVAWELRGEELSIEVYSNEVGTPLVLVEGPQEQSSRSQAKKTGPGSFKETISLWGRGVYTIGIYQAAMKAAYSIWLPERELAHPGANMTVLGRISDRTGGKILEMLDNSIFSDLPLQSIRVSLIPWLAFAALLCLVGAIAWDKLTSPKKSSGNGSKAIDRQ
jgi:Ca-activated chloride channel family protein